MKTFRQFTKALITFALVVSPFASANADAAYLSDELAEDLDTCVSATARPAYYEVRESGSTVIDDTGEVEFGCRMQKIRSSSLSASTVSGYQIQNVLFDQGDRRIVLDSNTPNVAASVRSSVGGISCKSGDKYFHRGGGSLVYLGENIPFEAIVATAHSFFHDTSKERLDDCFFIPGNAFKDRVRIPAQNRFIGNPVDYEGDQDVAFIKIDDRSSIEILRRYGALPFARLDESQLQEEYDKGSMVELIAYSREHRQITVSTGHCRVVEKRPGDLLYGVKGVYLHSCDSNPQSSGGILVLTRFDEGGKRTSSIIGVHTGVRYLREDASSDELVNGLPFNPKSFAGVAVNPFSNESFLQNTNLINGAPPHERF